MTSTVTFTQATHAYVLMNTHTEIMGTSLHRGGFTLYPIEKASNGTRNSDILRLSYCHIFYVPVRWLTHWTTRANDALTD